MENNKIVHFDTTKDSIKDAWKILKENGKTRDALLIHLMYALGLRTGEVRLLKFEDVSDKDLLTIKVYRLQRGIIKPMQISQDVYNDIIDIKNELIEKDKYVESIRSTTKSEQVIGHFIFTDSKSSIDKKFKSNFGGILNKFNLRPKDLREISLNERNSGVNMIKTMTLADVDSNESFKKKRLGSSKNKDLTKKAKKSKKNG